MINTVKNIANKCDRSDKPEIVKIILLCVEAITGVLGGALILNQEHPYWALGILALGAATNKIINYLKWTTQTN